MKRLLFKTILLALVIAVPIPMMAAVDITVNISLPPPIVFGAPPEVIVMPDTDDVYAVPDIDVDLFFWNGWWWRLWEGRWYRSNYYDRGWGYYNNVPSFYFDVDPGWRRYYGDHNWYGHRWNYERIPTQRLQQNWKSWHNDRHWERKGTWGVQSYQPRPQQQRQELSRQRQQQYQQRPEVQQHQQWRQEQQKQQKQQKQTQPQVRKPQVQQQKVQQPRQQPQEKVQQPQRQKQKPQVQQPRQQPQEKVQQPQRQEQKPQVQQPRQQPQQKVQQPQKQEQKPQAQQPQHSQPQGKPEGGGEKQDRK